MNIKVSRIITNENCTLGSLSIHEKGECFTLEDTFRKEKIPGQTRIPAGKYEIKLRDAGGMTKRYAKKFDFHKGMLHLQDVPNFNWVYIHYGNYTKDTEGCILVGSSADTKKEMVGNSVETYSKIYKKIAKALETERVWIEVVDIA